MIVEQFVAWIGKADDAERADAASALATLWLSHSLPPDEQEAAEAAITALLDDPCDEVRAALASEFATEPSAPRHVVLALASDRPSVAIPVLVRSPVFLDGELEELVATCGREHQVAIACRGGVSPVVAAAIARHGCRDAAFALLLNEEARPDPDALHAAASRHGDDTELRRRLLKRRDLPPATRIMLIDRLGETLRGDDSCRDIPPARLEALIASSRDRAVISWASRAEEAELPGIVEALVGSQRLTAAFLLRTVCMGNLALFSAALARLSGLSCRRVEAVLADRRRNSFRAVYVRTGMPDQAFEVFARAVELWREGLERADPGADLVYRVTRDLLAAFGARSGADFDPLLVLLRRLAAEAARDHARCRVSRIAIEAQERERLLLEAPAAQEEEAAEESMEVATDPLEAFPVIEVPGEVLARFAVHLAEEIVEMELANEEQAQHDATELAQFASVLEAANDRRVQAGRDGRVIDFAQARRFARAA